APRGTPVCLHLRRLRSAVGAWLPPLLRRHQFRRQSHVLNRLRNRRRAVEPRGSDSLNESNYRFRPHRSTQTPVTVLLELSGRDDGRSLCVTNTWSTKTSPRSSLSLDEDVVAGCAVEDILARTANQDVVASSANQAIVALAADQDIVAIAAVLGELNSAGLETGRLNDIVTG